MSSKKNNKNANDEDYIIYTETNKRRKIRRKYVANGSWSPKENETYLNFLENNKEMFETEFLRRSTKVFRKMSSLLRRRDPEQCRSHHQKLVIKYNGDLQLIIEKLKQKIKKSKAKAALLAQREKKRKRRQKELEAKNQVPYEEKKEYLDQKPTGDRNMLSGSDVKIVQNVNGDFEITINVNMMQEW